MIGLGTIINVVAILVGGVIGLVFSRAISARYQETLMQVIGVCILFVGIGGAVQEMMTVTADGLQSSGTMMIVISYAVGSLLGEWINLERRIEQFGSWLKVKTGNAREKRFVDGFVPAGTPDDEIELLGEIDLHTTAVIGDDFSWARDAFPASTDNSSPVILSDSPVILSDSPVILNGSEESDFIQMTHYAPNELRYTYRTSRERAVIFSEVYYPSGWTLTSRHMDGDSGSPTELPLFRADWLLRGAILPAGEGELVMRFDPPSYRTGEALSRASSVTLLLLLVLSAGGLVIAARKQD